MNILILELVWYWIALYTLNNKVSYFDSFGVKYIPKEIKIFIDKSIVVGNIFRVQPYYWIICGYFCIGFIDFMLPGNTLTDITNLFASNDFTKNDDIILKYLWLIFKKLLNWILMKHIIYIQV